MSDAFTDRDLAYLRANYFTLRELCAGRGETPTALDELIRAGVLPAPSYVLEDGTGMFPADYFVLLDQAGGPEELKRHFDSRHRAAGGDPAELDADWEAYSSGVYGVCLKQVCPETVVRKTKLVDSLNALLADPRPESNDWRAQLRRQVWELDALEREFSPDHDRTRFEEPPTRDRLIAAARARYRGVFVAEATVA